MPITSIPDDSDSIEWQSKGSLSMKPIDVFVFVSVSIDITSRATVSLMKASRL